MGVVGAADEQRGEVPFAFVALESGATASELELLEFPCVRFSKIKIPKQIIFLEASARNAYRNVLKLRLQDHLRDLQSAAPGKGNVVSPEKKSL